MLRLPIFGLFAVSACVAVTLPAASSAASLLDQNGNPAGFHTLAIGDSAPDFALPGIDGETHKLSEFAGPDVLMVLFTSNHCPTSHAMEQRLAKLRSELRGRRSPPLALHPDH